MKTSVQERIIAGRANYTPDALLRELDRVAKTHRGFRERKVGEWSVELSSTDPVHEESYLQGRLREQGTPLLPSALTTQYAFTATRSYPSPTFSMVTYNFSATSALDNVQLPEHLARYIYGAYKNPLEQAGPVSSVQSVDIHIDTEDKELHVCQNAKYIDIDGMELVSTCSNMTLDDSDEVTAITQVDMHDDSGDVDMDFFNVPPPIQFRADAAQHLEQTDAPTDPVAQELFKREFAPDRLNLDLAYFTLRSMKHAMRQIGMGI